MLEIAVLVLVVLLNSILALLVLLRNPRDTANQLYAVLVASAIAWGVANELSNYHAAYGTELLVNRLAFMFGFLLVFAPWLFTLYFPSKNSRRKIQSLLAAIVTPLVIIATTVTPLVVKSVEYQPGDKITSISPGTGYAVYVIIVIAFLALIAWNLIAAYRNPKVTAAQQQQIQYVAAGIFIGGFWILITSALLPAWTHTWESSKLGSVGSFFLAVAIAYAIIRHRLFDIKLVVARLMGYVLSLASLSALYILVAVVLAQKLVFPGSSLSHRQELYLTLMAVVLVFAYRPIKVFFDRLTHQIFYRGEYDPKIFVDQINQALTSTLDLDDMLTAVATVIARNLNSERCIFIINKTQTLPPRTVGVTPVALSGEDIASIHTIKFDTENQTVITDFIEPKDEITKQALQKSDIALCAHLTSNSQQSDDVGYMVLGPKQNGSLYTEQDARFLQTLNKGIVIGVQNAMRFEEIQNFNLTLQVKIEAATKQLQEANVHLQELDKVKDDFLSMATHQLDTPLVAIDGYIEMVETGVGGPVNDKQKNFLSQAQYRLHLLKRLVSDFLNVSRMEVGRFTIDAAPTDLNRVVLEEVDELQQRARDTHVTLQYIAPQHPVPILSLDEQKTRQAVMNLVDNAIHYTPNGIVKVYLNNDAQAVTFKVIDNGIGVPEAQKAHLFTKYFRADNAKHERANGNGIGLYLVKRVVEDQGGKIIFQSSEGKGSTFGFTLPLIPAPATPSKPATPSATPIPTPATR